MGALGATGAAQAVNVNPDGLGQALIYPYYTTQGTNAPYNSLLLPVCVLCGDYAGGSGF